MTSVPILQIAETVEQVAAIRDVWVSMQSHPDADFDFYLTLLNTRSEILRPHVVTLNENGSPISILIGRVEKVRLTVGMGYRKLSLPSVRCLTLIGTALGDLSDTHLSALINSVATALKNKDADVAWFHKVEVNSSLCKILRGTGGLLSRDHFPVVNEHWRVKLPATYDQFIRRRSSNTRHNLKRYTKRLQESYGDQIAVRFFRNPRDIDSLMEETEKVASKTYHRGLKVGFVDDDETRRRMQLYASQDRLRAYILYIGDKPIAFWNGFHYGSTFFTWTTGYDPHYRDLRPGLFLLQRVFMDLCGEKTVSEVDFGSGDAQYKRDWCDDNREEVSMYLFAPNVKGVALNALRTPLLACSGAARWGLNKTNLLQRAKKLWRSSLSSGEGAGQHAGNKV
jgi:hypothetical protein